MFDLLSPEQKDALLTCIFTSVYQTSDHPKIERHRKGYLSEVDITYALWGEADEVLGIIFTDCDQLPREAAASFLIWRGSCTGREFKFYSW